MMADETSCPKLRILKKSAQLYNKPLHKTNKVGGNRILLNARTLSRRDDCEGNRNFRRRNRLASYSNKRTLLRSGSRDGGWREEDGLLCSLLTLYYRLSFGRFYKFPASLVRLISSSAQSLSYLGQDSILRE